MICINRKIASLAVLLVLFSGLAAAEVPELLVSPNQVQENLSAHNVHRFEFKFTNNNSEKKIYNVTLKNQSYLNWSVHRFSLNASESKTVEAMFYKPSPGKVNDSFMVPYYYNQSGNITFNKNYYPEIRFNVSTFYRSTRLKTDVFDKSFELQFGESESSVFEVKNVGNETAFNVKYRGEDIEFGQDPMFNLSVGDDRLVEFSVSIPKPEENATEATNQTYNRTVTIYGENFPNKTFQVEVFVPYKQYNVTEKSQSLIEEYAQLQKRISRLCKKERFQDSVLCGDDIVKYRNRTVYINRTPRANVTLTNTTIQNLNQLANQSIQGHQHLANRIDLLKNAIRAEEKETRKVIGGNLTKLYKQLEETNRQISLMVEEMNETQQMEEKEDRNRMFLNALVWILVLVIVISSLAYLGLKVVTTREMDRRW